MEILGERCKQNQRLQLDLACGPRCICCKHAGSSCVTLPPRDWTGCGVRYIEPIEGKTIRKINSLFSVLRKRLALLPGLPSARPHPACKDVRMLLESDYIQPPKPLPPIPVRVSRRSQLTAALRQHARPIVSEDQGLARPFARLLRARELRLWAVGEFVADTMSHAIGRSYGANIEAHWSVGRYVLPGNVQKVILKPKPYGAGRLPRHLQA